MLGKLWKTPPRKIYQNLRKLQGKYRWLIFAIVEPFFMVHSNITYDSEAYDLVSSQFELYILH